MVHTLVTLRCMFFDPSYNLKCERHVIFLFDFNFEYCNRNGPRDSARKRPRQLSRHLLRTLKAELEAGQKDTPPYHYVPIIDLMGELRRFAGGGLGTL